MKSLFLNLKAYIKSQNSKIPDKVAKKLIEKHLKISTAESCTGGLLSSRLTDMSGSSAYISLNFVTYSNESKQKVLNVSLETLKQFGAVSKQCAYEMANGLIELTKSDVVLCTTGIAGPTGDENKPIGLIYIACGYRDKIEVREFNLNSKYNRKNMKFMFTEEAFKFLLEKIA